MSLRYGLPQGAGDWPLWGFRVPSIARSVGVVPLLWSGGQMVSVSRCPSRSLSPACPSTLSVRPTRPLEGEGDGVGVRTESGTSLLASVGPYLRALCNRRGDIPECRHRQAEAYVGALAKRVYRSQPKPALPASWERWRTRSSADWLKSRGGKSPPFGI